MISLTFDALKKQFILKNIIFTDPLFFHSRDHESLFLKKKNAGFIVNGNIAKQLVKVQNGETIADQHFKRLRSVSFPSFFFYSDQDSNPSPKMVRVKVKKINSANGFAALVADH